MTARSYAHFRSGMHVQVQDAYAMTPQARSGLRVGQSNSSHVLNRFDYLPQSIPIHKNAYVHKRDIHTCSRGGSGEK